MVRKSKDYVHGIYDNTKNLVIKKAFQNEIISEEKR